MWIIEPEYVEIAISVSSSNWHCFVAFDHPGPVFRNPGPNFQRQKICLMTLFNCKTILIFKHSLNVVTMQNIEPKYVGLIFLLCGSNYPVLVARDCHWTSCQKSWTHFAAPETCLMAIFNCKRVMILNYSKYFVTMQNIELRYDQSIFQ